MLWRWLGVECSDGETIVLLDSCLEEGTSKGSGCAIEKESPCQVPSLVDERKEVHAVARSNSSLPLHFLCLAPSSGGKITGKRRPRRVASASSRSESLVTASTSRGGFDGAERHGEEELEVEYDVRFFTVVDGWDCGDDEDDDHDEARCCRAAKGERVVSWTWV